MPVEQHASESVATIAVGSAVPTSTSDQRPCAVGGPSAVSDPMRGRPPRAGPPDRFLADRARTAAKLSLVTSPAHTRSHSASSVMRSSLAAEVAEEAGAARCEDVAQAVVFRLVPACRRRPPSRGNSSWASVPQEQPHLAVVLPERPGADPHDLAGREQVVEQAG